MSTRRSWAMVALGVSLCLGGLGQEAALAANIGRYTALTKEIGALEALSVSDGNGTERGQSAGAPRQNGKSPLKGTTLNFEELAKQNPDVIGWIEVSDTGISLPVCNATAKPDGWYLEHDFWGAASQIGCPFLDEACKPDGAALLIYGHHLTGSDAAFSKLYDMFNQERFNGLTRATLILRDGHALELEPLCASNVADDDKLSRQVSFQTADAFHSWLRDLCERADARSMRAHELAGEAVRAVSLVTCSSALPGQPWRCVTTFVERRTGNL